MSIKLKAIIFDFGNVLSLPPSRSNLDRIQELCNLHGETFETEYRKNRPDYDRGTIDGKEYWERILRTGGAEASPDTINALISEDIKSWSRVNNTVLKWAKNLRQYGYSTAILSNMPKDMLDYINSHFDWLKEFTVRVFSCEQGMNKPEPPIYRHCLQELGVDFKDSLFMDDSPDNIEAALKLGINGIVFRSIEESSALLSGRYSLPAIQT